jgi:hypothetical protein
MDTQLIIDLAIATVTFVLGVMIVTWPSKTGKKGQQKP